ncbi:uncharacterized protein LOC135395562 [Ornithodoros turicata]|uniref:uncharacterized protein LOC135395562 n=1 Tax=Ornithodoros turicata TaxID=34597 RepID=UPI00313A4549
MGSVQMQSIPVFLKTHWSLLQISSKNNPACGLIIPACSCETWWEKLQQSRSGQAPSTWKWFSKMDAILHARPRSTAFECGVDSAMISASDDENGAPAASEVELDSQSNSREDDIPSPDPEEHEQMHHQRKRKRRDARLEDLEKLLQQSAERGEKAAAQRAEMAHERQVVLLQEERDHFRQVMADLNGEFIQNCQQMITAFHHQQLSLLQMYMNSTQDTQQGASVAATLPRSPLFPQFPSNAQFAPPSSYAPQTERQPRGFP